MTINRRTALRQLAIFSAGAVLLPSCAGSHSKPDLVLKHFTVTGDQQNLLERFVATLIPTTDTPGAGDTGAALFLYKMVDDCMSASDRKRFFSGMQQFDDASRKAGGSGFVKTASSAREALLIAAGEGKLPGDDLAFFYSTARQLTIQAYTTSPYFLTRVEVYELVPGRWHGCVPVNKGKSSAT
jgi:hypothetical protein